MKRKAAYAVGEVARLCGVAPRTVSKWFDSGFLKGYKIPSGGHRRIAHDALVAFLQERNIRIPEELCDVEGLEKIPSILK